jgi:unconventional prefoldin RPB5 interactor 1
MARSVKDSFLDLERHRQLLENNIEKLQKSLRHWQTWEAEYEGLKEEILAADPSPNRQQLSNLASAYEGDLVTQKEIVDILGPSSRTATQVVALLDHRINYVEQNVKTVQKQLDAADQKLAAATIISTPDVRNEEGLPMTEIMEELDDDGNVISSHITTPGSAKPQLLEVLKKAGVTDLPTSADVSELPKSSDISEEPAEEASKSPSSVSKPAKKGVKFAADTKAGPEPEKSQTAKRIEDIMRLAKQSEQSSEPPIIPPNESAEDAALRREMLQYGASEIGAVVAELDLEEGSDWSDEDYDDETDTDEEDRFGRSTRSVVDDELRQRMIELEERLGSRMMENIGKKASDPEIVREGIGRVTINRQDADTALNNVKSPTSLKPTSPTSGTTSKKDVRFSEDLDISPAPSKSAASMTKPHVPAPITDIVERVTPSEM